MIKLQEFSFEAYFMLEQQCLFQVVDLDWGLPNSDWQAQARSKKLLSEFDVFRNVLCIPAVVSNLRVARIFTSQE